jgi:hypothetical protein
MNEPKIIENVQKLSWNFEDMKQDLTDNIKKYVGLVVSETNLAEMEKTQREIASMRTKLNKFRLATKKRLDKPYDEFKMQIDQLLDLVGNVEIPIKDQIDKYEQQRRKIKIEEIQQFIITSSNELGLQDKFSDQIVIDDRWLNRGQNIKDTQDEVNIKICWLLDIQQKEIEAATFKQQKIEMAEFMVESLSAGLVTPLTFSEIESKIDSLDIGSLKAYITGEVGKRREREDRAKKLAEQEVLDRQERERVRAEQEELRRIEAEQLREAKRVEAEQLKLIRQQEEAEQQEIEPCVAPPEPLQQISLYNVNIQICKVTQEDINAIFELIKLRGIKGKRTISLANE